MSNCCSKTHLVYVPAYPGYAESRSLMADSQATPSDLIHIHLIIMTECLYPFLFSYRGSNRSHHRAWKSFLINSFLCSTALELIFSRPGHSTQHHVTCFDLGRTGGYHISCKSGPDIIVVSPSTASERESETKSESTKNNIWEQKCLNQENISILFVSPWHLLGSVKSCLCLGETKSHGAAFNDKRAANATLAVVIHPVLKLNMFL